MSYSPDTIKIQMKSCTLWEKDMARRMDELKLEPLAPTPKDFRVVDAGSGAHKVTTNAVIPTTAYPDDSQNVGLTKGQEKITNSKVIVLMDRLHLYVFQQEKCLPNGVDVHLRFNRSRPQFYMMTDAGSSGKVVIQSMFCG
jgi:hypothetical protein